STDELLELEQQSTELYQSYLSHEIAKQLGRDVTITLRDENISSDSRDIVDDELIEQFNSETSGEGQSERFFVSEDKKTAVLVVWPKEGLESLSDSKRMVIDATHVINALNTNGYGDGLQAGIAGRIANKVAQFDAIIGDLKMGLIGSISLITLLIVFSFRSLIAIPSIYIPLVMGIIWTIGLTAMTIGGMNLITIFLALILFGLGIDFGIHNFSRYREERREGRSIEKSIETIIVDTGAASLIAALTTGVGFYALMLTEFRAFTEFGFIAGSGVLLTFVSMYTVFPALVVVMEKLGIWHTEKSGRRLVTRRKFSKLRQQARNKVIYGGALGLLLFSIIFAPQVKFERNFDNLEAKKTQTLQAANERLREVFPDGHNRAIVVVETLEEVAAIDAYIKNEIKTDIETPTIRKVSSLLDFLPDQESQKQRHEVITRLQKRAEVLRSFYPSKYSSLQRYLSIDDLNLADMPAAIRRTYIGTNSEPGYLMFIYSSVNMNDSVDAQLYYDDAAKLDVNGKTYFSASESFIFVEMLALMRADAVKAISLVALFTAIMVFIFLRSFSGSIVVLIPPLLGVLLTVGIMGAFGPKLSIMNMVILPSLIGISVDNSIHIFHRFVSDGKDADIAKIMNNTGRAAILTTLTTLLGFGGMVTASMGGLRSMGTLAIIGFTACLVITWTLLPALLGAYRKWTQKTGKAHGAH
ncbi:MAG: MMPL family transporter, partial [Robiginitomaculum sp.]|nr:MMPL family transporter [Robiginitomaculum sp.]